MNSTPAPAFASLQRFQAYLDGLGQFRMRLELDRMQRCLQALGLGQPPCPVVRVVGTNGKGSVCWTLARIAAAHGIRTGLYTSPHFISPKERIFMLDPAPSMPDDEQWLELAEAVHAAGPAAPVDMVLAGQDEGARREYDGLTYFEFLTAMAMLHFTRQGAQLAVIEAGLGARWDATAAIRADLVCLTPVGLDHENVLGAGIEAIAADKAHALRQGAQLAVSAPQREKVRQAYEQAAEGGARLLWLDQAETVPAPPREAADRLQELGGWREDNARLALAGWQLLAGQQGWQVDADKCADGIVQTKLPGRLQWVDQGPDAPPLLLDGAHNEDGLAALGGSLGRLEVRPQACVAAFMQDKDIPRMLALLTQLCPGALLFPELPQVPRAAPAGNLAEAAGPRGMAAPDLATALHVALAGCAEKGPQAPPVLVCGSLYLLGEFFTLHPELLRFE